MNESPPSQSLPAARPTVPYATSSLVCGIIGVATGFVGLILGIIAIVQSNKARRLLNDRPGTYEGSGMATAGLVLGIVSTIFGAFWLLYAIGMLAFVLVGLRTGWFTN